MLLVSGSQRSEVKRLQSHQAAPTNAPPPAKRYDHRILLERVESLYASTGLSALVSMAVAIILVEIHHASHPAHNHWGWISAMAVVLLVRAGIGRRFRQRPNKSEDPATWLLVYRVGALTTAAVWGLAGILLFPPGQSDLQAFTLLILAGISAGALSVNITDIFTYRLFVVLALTPVAINVALQPGSLQTSFGLLTLLMGTFLVMSAGRNYRAMLESIQLRFRNADLLSDLAREKQRLINEAETMMGKVLSCAPIALWAIDNNGTISFMDGNRIGQENDLKLPTIGDNLLNRFDGHSQIIYATQRALNGESFTTEIELYKQFYEVHYSPLQNGSGANEGAIGVAIDISERKRHEKELRQRAHYDELTGLPNRTLIMHQLEHAFEQARRQRKHVAVFFLDLDNFKGINDTMGHRAGDALLQQTAARLQQVTRDSDIPGRLGGDEFLVVGENLKCPDDAEVIAHKITHAFQRPFVVDGREIFATTSVGIAIYPGDGDTADLLLQSADTAMYQAKSQGKNVYRFFTGEMQQRVERHLVMETELRRALQRNELSLLYQPKVDLKTDRIDGVEALLRWHSPTLGTVSPEEFIAVAEVAGLMSPIGDWVMRTACDAAVQWQSLRAEPIRISVNVSPQQFRDTDLLANVTQALVSTGLPADLLELEITESVLVQDAPETLETFSRLRELGIHLSLDDFGTGYSSLSYLKTFPLQVLKIDKSFIQDLGRNPDDDSLVDAIIAMAQSLRLQIVAEGVETREQIDYLRSRDVNLVQGYYFSRPVEADAVADMLITETQGSSVAKAASAHFPSASI